MVFCPAITKSCCFRTDFLLSSTRAGGRPTDISKLSHLLGVAANIFAGQWSCCNSVPWSEICNLLTSSANSICRDLAKLMSTTTMSDLRATVIGVNAVLVSLSLSRMACRIGRSVWLVRSFGWNDGERHTSACFISANTLASVHPRRYPSRDHNLYSSHALNPLRRRAPHIRRPTSKHDTNSQSTPTSISSSTPLTGPQLVMASTVFYFACIWSIKHSLLLFYQNLTIDPLTRLAIYILHATSVAFGLTSILTSIFQCQPIHAMWDLGVSGQCINVMAFHLFNSSFMIGIDVILYAIPLLLTWNLRLQRPQRVGLNAIFALGGLVLAASGARVFAVLQQIRHPDFTYRFAVIMIWSVLENHLAIVIACAPTVKVLMIKAFPGLAWGFEKLVSGREETESAVSFEGKRGRSRPVSWEMG